MSNLKALISISFSFFFSSFVAHANDLTGSTISYTTQWGAKGFLYIMKNGKLVHGSFVNKRLFSGSCRGNIGTFYGNGSQICTDTRCKAKGASTQIHRICGSYQLNDNTITFESTETVRWLDSNGRTHRLPGVNSDGSYDYTNTHEFGYGKETGSVTVEGSGCSGSIDKVDQYSSFNVEVIGCKVSRGRQF